VKTVLYKHEGCHFEPARKSSSLLYPIWILQEHGISRVNWHTCRSSSKSDMTGNSRTPMMRIRGCENDFPIGHLQMSDLAALGRCENDARKQNFPDTAPAGPARCTAILHHPAADDDVRP